MHTALPWATPAKLVAAPEVDREAAIAGVAKLDKRRTKAASGLSQKLADAFLVAERLGDRGGRSNIMETLAAGYAAMR
jgi:hypothetical protein